MRGGLRAQYPPAACVNVRAQAWCGARSAPATTCTSTATPSPTTCERGKGARAGSLSPAGFSAHPSMPAGGGACSAAPTPWCARGTDHAALRRVRVGACGCGCGRYVAGALERLLELNRRVWADPEVEQLAGELARDIVAGVNKFGTYEVRWAGRRARAAHALKQAARLALCTHVSSPSARRGVLPAQLACECHASELRVCACVRACVRPGRC